MRERRQTPFRAAHEWIFANLKVFRGSPWLLSRIGASPEITLKQQKRR